MYSYHALHCSVRQLLRKYKDKPQLPRVIYLLEALVQCQEVYSTGLYVLMRRGILML